jgi:phosphate-selective porin OprO and OprP
MFTIGSLKPIFVILIITLFSQVTTLCQEQVVATPSPARLETARQSGADDSPLSEQVNQLRTKVEQLEMLVGRQQQALAEMEKRLADSDEKTQATVRAATAEMSQRMAEARIVNASLENTQAQMNAPSASALPQAAQPKETKAPLLAGWDDNHAFLKSADGNFQTFLTGYAQLDFRGYQSGNHPPNTFLIRRARLALEGKIARYYDFKLEGDFADAAGTLLRDFYVRVHRVDEVQFTAGHFKEPFSQEELRGDAFQDFVERSLVNNLSPSRSPGIMLSGVLKKGAFEYQLGAFNGRGLLAPNLNGTPEGALRLRFSPWKTSKEFWLKGLAFGGSYALGRSSTGLSVRGLTESRSFSFFIPDVINGPITRANGELTWLLGPAAVRLEYDQTNQARNGLGLGGSNLPGVVAKGYAGQFTYLLTGENKPDSGAVSPRRNLFGDSKNSIDFGAWELKFRYSNLQIADATAKSNRAETIYFGPNWYLNRFVRYMLDFGIERYRDPTRTPRPGSNNFFVVLSRVQLAF